MKPWPADPIRVSVLLFTILSPAQIVSAQFSKLDDASVQMAKRLKPLKPSLVAVADFASPDDSASAQAHYFAWYLSESLQERGKKYLHVAEHQPFDKDIAKVLGPGSTTLTVQALHDAAPQIGVDVVVIGTVVKRDSSYLFEIELVRVPDGEILDTINASMEVSGFLDSLLTPVTPVPTKDSDPTFKAGVGRVGMPTCISCPDPSYTNLARAKQIQGRCVFLVVVSPDGRAHQLRPLKLLGYGLDEEAYNAIKKWKFRPATQDGTPVATAVPVEVTFRLY